MHISRSHIFDISSLKLRKSHLKIDVFFKMIRLPFGEMEAPGQRFGRCSGYCSNLREVIDATDGGHWSQAGEGRNLPNQVTVGLEMMFRFSTGRLEGFLLFFLLYSEFFWDELVPV